MEVKQAIVDGNSDNIVGSVAAEVGSSSSAPCPSLIMNSNIELKEDITEKSSYMLVMPPLTPSALARATMVQAKPSLNNPSEACETNSAPVQCPTPFQPGSTISMSPSVPETCDASLTLATTTTGSQPSPSPLRLQNTSPSDLDLAPVIPRSTISEAALTEGKFRLKSLGDLLTSHLDGLFMDYVAKLRPLETLKVNENNPKRQKVVHLN